MRLLYREVFLDGVYRAESITRPEPLIVDCGANVGFSTLYFKRMWPTARVISIEPSISACAALEATVRANHLKGVEIHCVALTKDGRPVALLQDPKRLGSPTASMVTGNLESVGGRESTSTKMMSSVRLSELCLDQPVIDLLKIDVEGAEHEIIEDLLLSGLVERVDQLILEVNVGRKFEPLGHLLTQLETAGFLLQISGSARVGHHRQDLLVYGIRRNE